jgi:predicted RNA polymerase sigma factor
LFCFDSARLSTRRDEHGVFVPLEDQDRSRWDRARIERGLMHLARAATGDHMSRWHLEAGIAWAARADLERRAGHHAAARDNYERAIALARSPAERVSYERRIETLKIS